MTALRAFSLAFLAWHLGLLFPGLAEPWFLASAAAAGLLGGVTTRPLKWYLSLAAALGVIFAAQLVLVALPSWGAGSSPSPLDTVPLWSDRQLLFSLPFFALAWFEGWAFAQRNSPWERLIHAAAAVAVFWSQGHYHVTLYPHPLALALAFGLFLLSEALLLSGRLRVVPKAATLLVIVLGLGFLWSLLGRYEDQSTASGGGLMKPDLFQFDFAPLVRLEDEITLGEDLVLLYREEGTPRTRYLRRMVLTDYNPAQGFSVSGGKPPAVGRRPQSFQVAQQAERVPVRQEYYLVNLDPSSLLALNAPVTVTPYAQWNRSSFVNAYRVESLTASDNFWMYNEAQGDGLSAEERAEATRGGDPEIKALALEITKKAETPFEKATAIQLYLREHYYYSLRPGSPGSRGALKHFLFEGKKGYCSYFAFSMTLLLRSLDIPARIAVGFATNPDDAVLGFTPVRAFQAHAWVEVPFGAYGWIDFDPTSETPAPGEPMRFPKSPDPQQISKLIAEILEAQPQPLTALPPPEAAPAPLWERVWQQGLSAAPWLLLVLLVLANEAWRHRWRWARWRTEGRARVRVQWREVVYHARRARCGPRRGETPESWAARQDVPGLSGLAHTASKARYALQPPALPLPDHRAVRRHFDSLRPLGHRIVSVLFPWWPR